MVGSARDLARSLVSHPQWNAGAWATVLVWSAGNVAQWGLQAFTVLPPFIIAIGQAVYHWYQGRAVLAAAKAGPGAVASLPAGWTPYASPGPQTTTAAELAEHWRQQSIAWQASGPGTATRAGPEAPSAGEGMIPDPL